MPVNTLPFGRTAWLQGFRAWGLERLGVWWFGAPGLRFYEPKFMFKDLRSEGMGVAGGYGVVWSPTSL